MVWFNDAVWYMVGGMFGFAILQILGSRVLQPRRAMVSFVLLVFFLNTQGVVAESEVASDNIKPSQVYESCLVCHSTKEMQRGPILDGLPSWYVVHQLSKFDKGIRGAKEENKSELLMHPVVQQYSDPVIWEKVAAQIERQPKPDHIKTIRGNPERGKVLFAVCASCHGSKGQGKEDLKAPPLNVQEDWYLMDQLRKFQIGMRGYHSGDIEGTIMQNIVGMYSLNDLKDIVAFIARMEVYEVSDEKNQ